MASTTDLFENIFLTYKDIKEQNPDWSEKMIEDYLSFKRDLITTANVGDETSNALTSNIDPLTNALIYNLQRQVGSGNPLTCDETGFTVDSIDLTVDMTEA